MLLSGLAYKNKRGGSNATYYGKTKHHFKVRICEYLGISHLTGIKLKIDNNKLEAIQEHLLCCNYSPSFDDFSILTREGNNFKFNPIQDGLFSACSRMGGGLFGPTSLKSASHILQS